MNDGNHAFDYQPRTRVIFGAGSLARLGELARELGGTRVLLVTDEGIVDAGHVDRARRFIETAGLECAVFDRVRENPTTREVDECLTFAKEKNSDLVVGLGGGSSMDTAKGCNFLLTNGGRMQDYWGVGKASKEMLPLIAVPTTAGTGSECQSFALIADAETHQKMACGDAKAAARIALLDPELTVSQPRRVTACTGIDTIAHAVETAVTSKRNALSLMYSYEAFTQAIANLPRVLTDPRDLAARGCLQWAAALAGMAIENSMLGAAHAAANPLTARFGIVHGEAVGMMLPLVVRFNGQDEAACDGYMQLASAARIVRQADEPGRAVAAIAGRLDWLLNQAGMPRSLEEAGVERSAIGEMAAQAAAQWTAQFNPRPIGEADFAALYEAAFEPRGEGDGGAFLRAVRSRTADEEAAP